MPILRSQGKQLVVGDYYFNRRTGVLIEVVETDAAGNCRVLDASAPLDAEPLLLRQLQIRSCIWQRVDTAADSRFAGSVARR
jgi:hypothetical protein